ncbi:SAM-dependent methyltransferase [Nocardia callitridis]|uniref:SAM-dependent methyltransferase n=1 Tax=Nocardia callitridis TaxID=648753 RepID=A0ABP9KQN8_9NOCA
MTDVNDMDLHQDTPHSARIYDYLLGGKDFYEADRLAAEQIEIAIPDARLGARSNREFMNRAVRYLAENGIRQFLDIGTGIPTEPNLHQIVQEIAPESRVVYADNDPIVLAHARALLSGTPEGKTQYIHADITAPRTILESQELRETLDLSKPVSLSIIALAHFITGERVYDIVRTLLEPLAPGSHLVMSHLTADFDPETIAKTMASYEASGIPLEARDKEQVTRFFDDLELVEPGIVQLHQWRNNGIETPKSYDTRVPGYAIVARKP